MSDTRYMKDPNNSKGMIQIKEGTDKMKKKEKDPWGDNIKQNLINYILGVLFVAIGGLYWNVYDVHQAVERIIPNNSRGILSTYLFKEDAKFGLTEKQNENLIKISSAIEKEQADDAQETAKLIHIEKRQEEIADKFEKKQEALAEKFEKKHDELSNKIAKLTEQLIRIEALLKK